MNYYFAPLEGITGYIYRNTYEKHFGGISKYFTPFITTNQHFKIQNREKKDILPENNRGIYLVPQILTNNAEQFIDMARKIQDLGYQEINLNLGCPSRTVVTKKKGSGFLAYPEELNQFLDEIFWACQDMEISIKTRIGMENAEEFDRILQIYNKYPLKELIIHPRLQSDYYKNHPNMDVFISMLPMYGCVGSYHLKYDKEQYNNVPITLEMREEAYQNYIDTYGQILGEFAYDYYPMHTGSKDYLQPTFYMNLEMAAKSGLEKGFPIAIANSPTLTVSEFPRVAVVKFSASIFSTAKSEYESVPITLASYSVLSLYKCTVNFFASDN